MTKEDFDLLYYRYVENMKLKEMAEKYGKTSEGIRQHIDRILNRLLHEKYMNKWKMKNDLISVDNDDLLTFIFFMGSEHTKRLSSLINHFNIERPSDFLKIPQSRLLTIKHISNYFLLNLKLALLKFGLPYNNETIDQIESKLINRLKVHQRSGKKLRFKILKRDKFKCQYCGKSPRSDPTIILHVDHMIPISKGGTWDENNLVTACEECNLGKNTLKVKREELFGS